MRASAAFRLWAAVAMVASGASIAAAAEAPQVHFAPVYPGLRFVNPVCFTDLRDGRQLVGEVGGKVHVFDARADVRTTRVVLDLSANVVQRNFVEGLLGLALHPQWPKRREVYVFYASRGWAGAQVALARFVWPEGARDIDRRSETTLLSIPSPQTYHHGGALEFGADGFLYVGVGDMGPQHDTENHAQNLGSLRGKILRLDVESPPTAGLRYAIPRDNPFVGREGARAEIWALGFRNPYRFSFDPPTATMWVADVGQVTEEEIDLVVRGGNYGWNLREGTKPHTPAGPAAPGAKLLEPLFAYGRQIGASVTGGYVYRGKAIPALVGAYVFGDWVSSAAFFLRQKEGRLVGSGPLGRVPNPSTFGLGADGELYALSMEGRVLRLSPGPAPATKDEGPPPPEHVLQALARTASFAARGKRLFAQGCNACHGNDGQGGIGPNLRDDHWLRGSRMTDIVRSIAHGNVAAGMPAWREVYPPTDVHALAAHVARLSAGADRSGKEAQGKVAPVDYLR